MVPKVRTWTSLFLVIKVHKILRTFKHWTCFCGVVGAMEFTNQCYFWFFSWPFNFGCLMDTVVVVFSLWQNYFMLFDLMVSLLARRAIAWSLRIDCLGFVARLVVCEMLQCPSRVGLRDGFFFFFFCGLVGFGWELAFSFVHRCFFLFFFYSTQLACQMKIIELYSIVCQ